MNEIISEIAGLRMELKEIKESFQNKKRDMLVLYNEKLPMIERAEEIELSTAYEVSIECDESGKKIYSNDILRNAESRKRLQRNVEYESLKERLDFLERDGRNLKNELDILDMKFRIIEQTVSLLMVQGHIHSQYKDVTAYELNN